MKKFFSAVMLTMAMLVMMAMPVSASRGDRSPQDDYLKNDKPGDEYMTAPKTGDESFAGYAMAMAAIAAAGTIVIAKKKEA